VDVRGADVLAADLERLQGEYADELRRIQEIRARLERREALIRTAMTAASQIMEAERARTAGNLEPLVLPDMPAPATATTGDSAAVMPPHPDGARKADRVLEVVEEVLREAGAPLHYRNLAVMVQGRIPLGDHPQATLASYLSRAEPGRFVRLGRGIYCLPGQHKAAVEQPVVARRRRRRRKVAN